MTKVQATSMQSVRDRLLAASRKALENPINTPNKGSSDSRLFRVSRNKMGGNNIVLRLLPSAHGDNAIEAVNVYKSFEAGISFRAPSQDEISAGFVDFVSTEAWNSWRNGDRDKFRKLMPTQRYFTNVFVIKDSVTPDNEGKVFMLEFGRQLYTLIASTISGEGSGEPGNPFDMLGEVNSMNLTWRVTTPPGQRFPKYEFGLVDDYKNFGKRTDLETIFDSTYNLTEFVNGHFQAPTAELLYAFRDAMLNEASSSAPNGIQSYGDTRTETKPTKPVQPSSKPTGDDAELSKMFDD